MPRLGSYLFVKKLGLFVDLVVVKFGVKFALVGMLIFDVCGGG